MVQQAKVARATAVAVQIVRLSHPVKQIKSQCSLVQMSKIVALQDELLVVLRVARLLILSVRQPSPIPLFGGL